MHSETICCARAFCGSSVRSCISRHSRRLRAATPSGSNSCTDGQGFFDVFHGIVAVLGDLLERDGQIAVFIEVADDHFGDFAHRFVANRDAQLPGQMVGQALRRGDKFFERRLFDHFVLAAAVSAAAIQILVEEGGDVEFVERIGGLGLRNFFGFGFDEGLFAVILARRGLSSVISSSIGLATISWVIISRSSRRFSARTLTICTRPGVRICFCATLR